jgi:cytoskeletal protein RodZ
MADDFEVTSEPLEQGENRTFVVAAAALGALIILSLICLGVYALVLQPRQRQAALERPTEIMLTNTAVAVGLTEAAAEQIATFTPLPSNTPQPSATPRPTNTNTASPTPVIVLPTDTPTRTPTPFTTLATVGPETATAAAQQTATALAIAGGAATPTRTPTALPTTGFGDEAGLPGLAGLAAVFLAVIILSRRLRTRTAG